MGWSCAMNQRLKGRNQRNEGKKRLKACVCRRTYPLGGPGCTHTRRNPHPNQKKKQPQKTTTHNTQNPTKSPQKTQPPPPQTTKPPHSPPPPTTHTPPKDRPTTSRDYKEKGRASQTRELWGRNYSLRMVQITSRGGATGEGRLLGRV